MANQTSHITETAPRHNIVMLWKSLIFNELHIEPITQGFSICHLMLCTSRQLPDRDGENDFKILIDLLAIHS